jgi:hypothetical protein
MFISSAGNIAELIAAVTEAVQTGQEGPTSMLQCK